MRKLSIGDYYFCSLCQKWHRVPTIGLGQEHLKYFDAKKTNSDIPEYYYCSLCRRPHHNNRKHLNFKIPLDFVTNNNYMNNMNNRQINDNILNHNDILSLIEKYIISRREYLIYHKVFGTNSLPRPCTRESRLYLPDLILCKDLGIKENFKSRYSISHIVELETQTGSDFIIDKIKRANECIKIMIQHKDTQSTSLLPKLIFLYRQDAPISLDYIRKEAEKLQLGHLEKVIIDYWDTNQKWYEFL